MTDKRGRLNERGSFNKKRLSNDKSHNDKSHNDKSHNDKSHNDKSHNEKGYNEKGHFSEEGEALQLEGRNAVLEAIKRGRSIDKLLIKSGDKEGSIRMVAAKAREAGYVIIETPKEKLDSISHTGNHQGVIAICPAYEYGETEDMLKLAEKRGQPPFIIILDGVMDPYNLGAIIRTAEAMGAHGVIIPKRRSAGITAGAVKAAAGALEYVPVARVTNLAACILELKKAGLWICGADPGGKNLYDISLSGPIAVVVGGEGSGVGRLILEKCDFTVNIPMSGMITSLNASVAAAMVMYEVARGRRQGK